MQAGFGPRYRFCPLRTRSFRCRAAEDSISQPVVESVQAVESVAAAPLADTDVQPQLPTLSESLSSAKEALQSEAETFLNNVQEAVASVVPAEPVQSLSDSTSAAAPAAEGATTAGPLERVSQYTEDLLTGAEASVEKAFDGAVDSLVDAATQLQPKIPNSLQTRIGSDINAVGSKYSSAKAAFDEAPEVYLLLLALTVGSIAYMYYRYEYGGYSGIYKPTDLLASLNEEENIILVDTRDELEQEENGVLDLRRNARTKAISLPPAEVPEAVRGDIDNTRMLQLKLSAALITSLANVNKFTKIVLMDTRGATVKPLAREICSLGYRCYIMKGGFTFWVRSGLPSKQGSYEVSAADLLMDKGEELSEVAEDTIRELSKPLNSALAVLTVLGAASIITYPHETFQSIGFLGLQLSLLVKLLSYDSPREAVADISNSTGAIAGTVGAVSGSAASFVFDAISRAVGESKKKNDVEPETAENEGSVEEAEMETVEKSVSKSTPEVTKKPDSVPVSSVKPSQKEEPAQVPVSEEIAAEAKVTPPAKSNSPVESAQEEEAMKEVPPKQVENIVKSASVTAASTNEVSKAAPFKKEAIVADPNETEEVSKESKSIPAAESDIPVDPLQKKETVKELELQKPTEDVKEPSVTAAGKTDVAESPKEEEKVKLSQTTESSKPVASVQKKETKVPESKEMVKESETAPAAKIWIPVESSQKGETTVPVSKEVEEKVEEVEAVPAVSSKESVEVPQKEKEAKVSPTPVKSSKKEDTVKAADVKEAGKEAKVSSVSESEGSASEDEAVTSRYSALAAQESKTVGGAGDKPSGKSPTDAGKTSVQDEVPKPVVDIVDEVPSTKKETGGTVVIKNDGLPKWPAKGVDLIDLKSKQ